MSFDAISSLASVLPEIGKVRERTKELSIEMEKMLNLLNIKSSEVLPDSASSLSRSENPKRIELENLIRQREAERMRAENAFNEKNNLSPKTSVETSASSQITPPPVTRFQSASQSAPSQNKPQFSNGVQPAKPQFVKNWGEKTNRFGRPFEITQNYVPFQRKKNIETRNDFGRRNNFRPGQPSSPGTGSRTFIPKQENTAFSTARSFALPRTEAPSWTPKVNTFMNNKKKGSSAMLNEQRTQLNRKQLLRRGIEEEKDISERMLTRVFKTKKAKENSTADKKEKSKVIVIEHANLTVKILSEKIGESANKIIKQLMVLGEMAGINDTIEWSTAELVAGEFGYQLQQNFKKTGEEKLSAKQKIKKEGEKLLARPPVVVIMGHVDHGKTTLLDRLRNSNVAAGESGGITQHIGAYQITVGDGGGKMRHITFLDTPGHAAFDKMRARGAKLTDIAILIVAGDDGVMPQTVEAIKHIQAQELPMIVAVNKCDKKEFSLDKVRTQLSEHGVIGEEWGGTAIILPISAVTGEGIDKLLETILLVADISDLKADFEKEAFGTVIEGRLDASKGAVVTVLVRNGTLHIGDTLLAGKTSGKIRAMVDDMGKPIRTATASMPVQVMGFYDVPNAGDDAFVVDEKLSKQVVAERKNKEQIKRVNAQKGADFDPFEAMVERQKKQLNVILRADVVGSLEAIIQTVKNITSDEVNVQVISSGVGMINDGDVDLASISNALLIGFNTKTIPTAIKNAEKNKVKIHSFNVIYEIFDFVTENMVRLFSKKFETELIGKAEIRALFKSSATGQIAGCMVLDGKILKSSSVIVKRGTEEIGKYKIDSIKIKTKVVADVSKGNECGIVLQKTPELFVGDILECIGEKELPVIFNGKEYKF
ncbi:MAG: translation initiation factor IF-2 [Christensenellaceae bacterium]|jgi:translation initiation factor IF-2|nr:translation initiation factor IF-2 [Christensenellaceae bacterium]